MSGVPYIRFFGDDWLSGTQALSLEERGALVTIVALTAATGQPPALDYPRLARRFGCTPGRAKKVIAALAELGKIIIEGDAIHNSRALAETEFSQKKSEKQSENASARWAKKSEKPNKNNGGSDAVAMPRECQPEPEPEVKEEAKASSQKKRGTRLPADWHLPREWGEWALSEQWPEPSSGSRPKNSATTGTAWPAKRASSSIGSPPGATGCAIPTPPRSSPEANMQNLPAAPTGFNALSPQQQQAHRAKIGVRAQAILGQFWHDAETPDAVQAIELEGWMDVLENCSHSEIRDAWRDYQTDSANRTARGRLAKPDAGAIRSIILRKRPKPQLVQPEPKKPSEPRVTAEQAQNIMREVGFDPTADGQLHMRMPGAQPKRAAE